MSLPIVDVPQYELILPSSGKKIKYRPYLVKEQKILLMAVMSDTLNEMVLAVKQIIKNCTFDALDVDTLPQFDIEYIFLKLRSKSVGEIVEPIIECPSCKKDVKLRVDLNQIEVTKPKSGNRIELAKGVGIIFKYPTLNEEAKIAEIREDLPEEYSVIYQCVDRIYDESQVYSKADFTLQEFIVFLENLNGAQFEKILAFFDEQPRVESKVDVKCVCGHSSSIVLRGIHSFLA